MTYKPSRERLRQRFEHPHSICRHCGVEIAWTGLNVWVHVLPSGACQTPEPGIQIRIPAWTRSKQRKLYASDNTNP